MSDPVQTSCNLSNCDCDKQKAMTDHAQQAQELEGIDDILARRPALADCVTRRDKIETAINVAKQVDDIKQQLAASQARCREMETELQKEHERSTAHFDLCVHKDTELAQLQATLAAREARIHDLERGLAAVLQVLQPFTEAQQARGSSGGAADHYGGQK